MCGILGSIDLPFSTSALDLIQHRGPDDWGIQETDVMSRHVILGHRRLSIVDLSPAGHQPMTTKCGRYQIVFNGEIYNHLEIRSTLRQKNFLGHSDTETILYALAERGIDAVREMNGIFGFAFLDTVKGKLYLARDPFGVKPVYYCHNGSHFAFCSEMRPLLAMVHPTVDPDALSTLLRLRYVPSPYTLFREIKKIVPGCYLEIDLQNPAEIRQTFLAEPLPSQTDLTFEEQLEKYQYYLEQAVKRQMMADVEVGILLSGGVDSALVARQAAQYSDIPLKAFTVGFTGQHQEDEIAEAAETAKLFGMKHYTARISDEDFFSQIDECISILEEPLATTSVIPMKALAKLASSEVKVVLTGQGADEPLGGYGRYQGEILHEKLPAFLRVAASGLLGKKHFRNAQLERCLKSIAIRDDIQRFIAESEVFTPMEISQLTGNAEHLSTECYQAFYQALELKNKKRSCERMMALDARMDLADDLLLYTDKITMHYSLECRVPLLDLDLVRYIESLPGSSRVQWKKGKLIHKKFAEKVLPHSIVYRPKKGFLSPTGEWFKKSDMLREILLDRTSVFARYFDQASVEDVIQRHKTGFNQERQIFLLLAVKYFLDRFARY